MYEQQEHDYDNKEETKSPSLRKAINAHCKACIYDPNARTGTWRQQVEACTVKRCDLYPVRPVAYVSKPHA